MLENWSWRTNNLLLLLPICTMSTKTVVETLVMTNVLAMSGSWSGLWYQPPVTLSCAKMPVLSYLSTITVFYFYLK
jgi:hypothetical protein